MTSAINFPSKLFTTGIVIFITEEGLDIALKCTEVLFNQNIETLTRMSEEEIKQLAANTDTVHSVLLPDTTVFDACMTAKCFGRPGMYMCSEGCTVSPVEFYTKISETRHNPPQIPHTESAPCKQSHRRRQVSLLKKILRYWRCQEESFTMAVNVEWPVDGYALGKRD